MSSFISFIFDSCQCLFLIYFSVLLFFIPIEFGVSNLKLLISRHTDLFQQGRSKNIPNFFQASSKKHPLRCSQWSFITQKKKKKFLRTKNKLVNFIVCSSASKIEKNYPTIHFHSGPDPCKCRQALSSSSGRTFCTFCCINSTIPRTN